MSCVNRRLFDPWLRKAASPRPTRESRNPDRHVSFDCQECADIRSRTDGTAIEILVPSSLIPAALHKKVKEIASSPPSLRWDDNSPIHPSDTYAYPSFYSLSLIHRLTSPFDPPTFVQTVPPSLQLCSNATVERRENEKHIHGFSDGMIRQH